MTQPQRIPQDSHPSDLIEEIERAERERWSARRLLEWGLDRFAPRIALSASFGSAEGMILLHMMSEIDPARTRVFTIDTGRLPQQTHDLIDRVRDRYGVEVEVYFPRPERVQAMVRERGMNLFYESVENRRLCCSVRKVEPLGRALADLDAWVAGLRRGQSVTREETQIVEVDSAHGDRIKLNGRTP